MDTMTEPVYRNSKKNVQMFGNYYIAPYLHITPLLNQKGLYNLVFRLSQLFLKNMSHAPINTLTAAV